MIVSAFPVAGGIQINREVDVGTLEAVMVMPGDPGWAGAVAAVAQFGGSVEAETPLEPTLEAIRADAMRYITALRGQARLAYITDLPGQDMLYMAKAEEARSYLADPAPDPADYPLIMSEVGVTAPTAYEVAQVFTNLNALWRYAAGSRDAACFQAEAAVHQAPDAQTIDAILTSLAAGLLNP